MASKARTGIRPFLEWLRGCVKREERGILADLRHGFGPATEHRAWPHLAAWGVDLTDDRERRIWLTIAAGFATLQETRRCGNMGATLRRIAGGDLQSFEGRFRRLLACATVREICDRLPAVIRAARQKGAAIDFEQLFWDLRDWNSDRRDVRVDWAQGYWAATRAPGRQEVA